MIRLDTNVLARLFFNDDPVQARLARRLVADRCTSRYPGIVDRVALCETIWVLTRAHGYGRAEIVRVIEELLASRDMKLEDEEVVRDFRRQSKATGRVLAVGNHQVDVELAAQLR